MKSKIKVTQKKDDNSTLVNYFNHKDATSYRYALLNEALKNEERFVMIIDTNRHLKEISIDELETRLHQVGINYLKSPIKATKRRIFGLQFLNFGKKKPEKLAYVLFFEIDQNQFSEGFFKELLYVYDLAIGVKPKKSLEQIQTLYLMDFNAVLFDKETFDETIYDSAIFSQLRSSIDIATLATEVE